jgi:PAS domain S-box-containing protein
MKTSNIHINEWASALSNQKLFYMTVVNRCGKLTFTNSHFFKSLHLTSESIINKKFFDFIDPNDLNRWKDAIEQCSTESKPVITEVRIRDGSHRWVKWEITCLRKPGKENETFLCLGYDIPCEEQIRKSVSISEQNYRTIVEGLNVGIVFQDKEGVVISANQKIAEIFDITLEAFYNNKKIYSLWKTTDESGNPLSFSDAPFMKALKTGEAQNNVVLNLQISEGNYRRVICNSQPLFEKDQSIPFSVVSTIQDITKEKKLEIEAGVREALFASFMNHSPYFTWIVDKNKKLVFANQSLLKYFRGDETAFGKNMFDLMPKSIASIFHEKHKIVFEKKLPDYSIVKSLMADGKELVYQVTVFPIRETTSEMMIGGEALDITEAYNARQEIKKTNEHLVCINQATSEAIWDWNMQTGHIFCNQVLHNIIGVDLGEVFDLNWCYQRIHEEDRQKIERIIKIVLEKKELSWEAEYRFRNSDGSYKLIYNRGFIIYENNEPIRMIGSMQDISVIRKLENDLVEQKLKQQKGIAEAIIHSQEEERTRIGYELHDNVNQILGTAQLYLSLLEPSKENFAEVKEKARKAILLGIDEIRKLAKEMVMHSLLEEGLLASINGIVEDLHFVKPFNITFAHDKKCDVEILSKNKKITLFRIVQEQIKNIIKYSNAKNVKISLGCSNDCVQLFIVDDGVGFDSKNTRRGLGLSNIYERTRLDNGNVILNTSPGEGCSLEVNIPFGSKTNL